MPHIPLTFSLTPLEMERFIKFRDKHRCSLRDLETKRRNPVITVAFQLSSMGDGVDVLCKCGAKRDITDYDSW